MAYVDYYTELMGHVPELDVGLAQILVNRAWKDIKEARLWSWLRGFGVLFAPQNITTGTVTVTQFSATVSLNAGANAALNNLTNPLIMQRQFRSGQGPVYNIAGYSNGGSTLTLDRPYLEGSASGQSYQVYRCYYQPTDPSGNLLTDFLMIKELFNPVDGYAVIGGNLRITRAELDARDPTRGAQDLLYCLASFTVDATGLPVFEAWPHPTSQRAYPFLYQKRGVDLSPTVDIPATLSKHLLINRALNYAYDWAIINASRFPTLKGVDWRLAKAENERLYDNPRDHRGLLQDAKRNDDNLQLDNYLPELRDYLNFPPIDAKFWQSHDVSSYFVGG
ncbi:MAG TPA: hypothetical protein VN976_21930 [Verrucomicrobiae bacterium]|nr:hypothetical protein [Verrucomicrobiae bacterium]